MKGVLLKDLYIAKSNILVTVVSLVVLGFGLSFLLETSALLVLAAGDAKIDNHKFKAEFGFKAKMLSPDDALRLTGHPVGGICPFGLANPLRIYLDASLRRHATVYPACGTSSSAVALTCAELEQASEAMGWVDVTKDPG